MENINGHNLLRKKISFFYLFVAGNSNFSFFFFLSKTENGTLCDKIMVNIARNEKKYNLNALLGRK